MDIVLDIPAEGIGRIDVWLATRCEGFSRARIQGLMKAGMVLLDGVPVTRSTVKARPGGVVTVQVPPPVPAEPAPQAMDLSILYEDDDLIALDKPAGLVVHPAPGHLDGTLVNALLHHCPRLAGIGGVARPGIVHRLDRDTSGVMVVAKSQRAMDSLTRAFATHRNLRKTYLALVHGVPRQCEGHIETLIGRCPFDRKKMAVTERNGKRALTHYLVRRYAARVSPAPTLVECRIETGRTHQIRVHMSSVLGCPVVGDELYGRPGWDRRLDPVPPRQLLHALRLELDHPVDGRPMVLTAPIPTDFKAYGDIEE